MSTQFQPLSNFALLHIHGPDSEKFLQGQLTCDVVKLPDNHWILGACCNAKGRMVANFVIAKTAEGFYLRMPQEQVTALQQHLQKYIVFFKAQMQNLAAEWQVQGKMAASLNAEQNSVAEPLPCALQENAIQLAWPDGRQELWTQDIAAENSSETTPETTPETTFQTMQAWQQADANLGYQWVTAETHLKWIPQNIDWQEKGGVSFTKGCYTGQEIVARVQYLGKNKG